MTTSPQQPSEIFGPSLKTTAKASMMVAMHIAKGRKANRRGKVAWVTSGFPVEILTALDFYTFYPENHGAICGAARQSEAISIEAENQGYSRELCSYARTDIGSLLSGKTPIRKIPAPSQCQPPTRRNTPTSQRITRKANRIPAGMKKASNHLDKNASPISM